MGREFLGTNLIVGNTGKATQHNFTSVWIARRADNYVNL